ncbi:V-type proton ATPase subunit E-like isoform X1 [Miscanthus floridulus]|uniref:V-type proton ATPase subunit E-like isoform X1 n=1 Tax=Miscanthus floridulus TaxID=154761 RepID=UPI003459EE16
MNDADVGKQVQQMVRFILQEADEKASEITVAAEEEFSIEKLQLVESEKRRVRQEYERKEKQVDVRRKIEYSTELNAARIKLLQAQDDVVTGVKESAGDALLRVTKDANAYKRVLKGLIVQRRCDGSDQSLLRLREPALVLRCRETDRSLVEAVLEVAKKEYAEKAKVNLPKVIIDGKFYLPPQRSSRDDAHGPSCSGGVVLASQDGKIVCDNTLDARLSVSFRQKLPEIRKKLFSHQVSQ